MPRSKYIFSDLSNTNSHYYGVRVLMISRNTPPEFISPDIWPPNSPDRNLVDYKIWGCVQERMYQKPIREVDQLKQRLVEVWSDVQQTVVDAAIGEWRERLRPCVRAKGHHFEHLL